MAKVLKVDCSTGGGDIKKNFGVNYSEAWLYADVALDATALADLLTNPFSSTVFDLVQFQAQTFEYSGMEWYVDAGPTVKWAAYNNGPGDPASTPFAPSPPIASMQFYRIKMHVIAGTPITHEVWIDGGSIGAINVTSSSQPNIRILDLFQPGLLDAGFMYFDNIQVGTTDGATDIFSDDFEGGDLSHWTSADAVFSVVDDPGISPPGAGGGVAGRVFIAFDDGPLEPFPVWTCIDQGGDFPQNFVSGYDIQSGRQTLLSQTDTGTASVYINDHKLALFDPRNTLSPYFGKLDGKQIMLQLYDPEAAVWEGQFRGLIDDISWVIDGSAVGADGQPINASIQIDCVDMFDYLAGFGLTPGLDGVTPRAVPSGGTAGGAPPTGYEDGVYYAQTAGTVDDRIIEILADVGVDPTRYTVASGNVSVKAVKYDPDESALQALRDAADAELPFIANIYCDRHGDFLFRGRYSSFDPDATAAEPGSTWDFQRWFAGDGAAIEIDPTRAQLRAFAFGRNRSDLINVAICYPQNMKPAQMPNQVYADTTSITDFGKHSAPPMSDLLTNEGSTSGGGFTTTDVQECFLFAKLTVLNQKDPRENIKTLTFKAIRPDGTDRSVRTWALITKADISHNVNVQVGYPAGYGFAGDSPEDDYRIQGRKMQVRPLNPAHDYVELDLSVTPAVWSMDTHGVFPAFPGAEAPALMADFTVAE